MPTLSNQNLHDYQTRSEESIYSIYLHALAIGSGISGQYFVAQTLSRDLYAVAGWLTLSMT